MRTLPLILILCLPLAAGDPAALAGAVESFGSERADEREAASRAVHLHLARELAPLLAAIRSEDPEVARRARMALESFLPREPVDDVPALGAGDQVFVVNQGGKGQQVRIFLRGGNGNLQLFQGGEEDAHTTKLKALGLEGYPLDDHLLRKHARVAAGRGFVLAKVANGSRARLFGLREDDIVLAVGGRRVMTAAELAAALGKLDAKDLRVLLLRDGRELELRPE